MQLSLAHNALQPGLMRTLLELAEANGPEPACDREAPLGAALSSRFAALCSEPLVMQRRAADASQKELDDLAAAIAAADDDAAVRLAHDPRAMALATPEQKAALLKKLMAGHTNAREEAAIKQILLSCQSREELDQVVQMAGGIEEIADELDAADLQAIGDHAARLTQKQDAEVQVAIRLLEQASSPEEFERLYKELGGERLKHKLPKPPSVELLARLEALAEKFDMPDVGFGMPPEQTAALQAALQKAIDEGDCDAIVKLSENADAMRAASPVQKARMIALLQDGWTKDSQDMAIARILMSCGSKAEFDQVVDMAGGPAILEDVDLPEAKADINKTMGGFDRLDCADDLATAQAYRGALMPPAVDALTRTRAPSEAEVDGVLGEPPYEAKDFDDPALAGTARQHDAARRKIGQQAYDLQSDPAGRNKLALENRARQMNGQPPLDYTSLVTRAYEVANDPSFLADVERAIAETERQIGPLDDEKKQEIREKFLEQRLAAVAQQYGLSEQALKTLVVAKMGRVLQEGAQAVKALGTDMLWRALPARIAEIERTEGRDSPKAKRLREMMDRLGAQVDAQAQRLELTGATAANLFKVPPSFAENFVKVLSAVTDVLAAVMNLVPGWGQVVSAVYYGVKTVASMVTGDWLGALKSVLSAVAGVTGIASVATSASVKVVNTVAKAAQAGVSAGEGIANGNLMPLAGALGTWSGIVVKDIQWVGPASEAAKVELGILAVKLGPQAAGMIEGAVRQDVNAVFDSQGRFFDEMERIQWTKK